MNEPSLESILSERMRLAQALTDRAPNRARKREIQRMYEQGNRKIITAYLQGDLPLAGLHYCEVTIEDK